MNDYSRLSSAYVKEDFVDNQDLRNAYDPSYCLTIKNSTSDPEMRLCDNTPSQKFTYDSLNQTIKSNLSNKCLDIKGNSIVSGTSVGQWDCGTSWKVNQAWIYEPSTKQIKSGFPTVQRYLDLKLSQSGINSATIVSNDDRSLSPSQKWFASNDCTLSPSPSSLPFGSCSATECGTTGNQTRMKYKVISPSSGLGNCAQINDVDSTPCSAEPCPVDCILAPSELPFGSCSSTECGTTGNQTRMKYKVVEPAKFGGKCDDIDSEESTPCSAAPCPVPSVKPSTTDVPAPAVSNKEEESFIEKNKWYLVGGGGALLLVIIVMVMMSKKQ